MEKEEFSDRITWIGREKMLGLRTARLSSAVGCYWRTSSTVQLGRMAEGA